MVKINVSTPRTALLLLILIVSYHPPALTHRIVQNPASTNHLKRHHVIIKWCNRSLRVASWSITIYVITHYTWRHHALHVTSSMMSRPAGRLWADPISGPYEWSSEQLVLHLQQTVHLTCPKWSSFPTRHWPPPHWGWSNQIWGYFVFIYWTYSINFFWSHHHLLVSSSSRYYLIVFSLESFSFISLSNSFSIFIRWT